MTSKRLPRVLVLSGAAPPSVGGAESLTHVLAVVVSRGDDDRGVSDRYPSMTPPTFDGTTILSADVAEITILKQALVEGAVTVDRGRAVVAESGHPRLDAVVSKLWDEGRMLFFPKGREDHLRGRRPLDQSIDFLAPLNPRAGLLTESERLGNPLAAFNAGFFIWAEEEFLDGPFASMHDPVGLVIEDGEIRWPPVYRRNALFVDTGTFALHDHEERYGLGIDRLVFAQCGLAEVAVRLPGDVVVVGPAYQDGRRAFGHAVDGSHVVRARVHEPDRRGEAAFVNRLWPAEDARSMATHFPAAKDGSGYELILVGRNIAGRNIGGDAFIPSHGFVVSLNALRHAVGSMRRWPQERRRWWSSTLTSVRPAGRPVAAAQGWLPLVVAMEPTDLESALGSDDYAPIDAFKDQVGVPPIYLYDRYVFAPNRALIGLGLRADGRAHVALIESCEPRTYHPEIDSVGGSTADLQGLLARLGAVQALAFDPGGSAGLVVDGQPLARAADRNDLAGVPGKRPIPGGWIVRRADR